MTLHAASHKTETYRALYTMSHAIKQKMAGPHHDRRHCEDEVAHNVNLRNSVISIHTLMVGKDEHENPFLDIPLT